MVDRRVHSMKRTLPTGTNAETRRLEEKAKAAPAGGTYGVGTLEDRVSRVDAVKPLVNGVSGTEVSRGGAEES